MKKPSYFPDKLKTKQGFPVESINKQPSYPPGFLVHITQRFRLFLIRLYRRFTHPNVVMWEHVHQMWVSAGIGVAAELGIADLLKNGSRSIGELAMESGTDEDALYRLMRMLASQGIFREGRNRVFRTTSFARPLQEDQIRYLVMIHLSPGQFRIFGDLLNTVKKGSGRIEPSGKELFEQLKDDSRRNIRFNLAMSNASQMQVSALRSSFPFRKYSRIIDVGGGQGYFLSALLEQHPESSGAVYDLPSVIPQCRQVIEKASLGTRMEAIQGDFFREIPPGGDLYILKSVLHDWSNEDAERILGNVHRAMSSTTRLLIIEAVIKQGNSYSYGKMMDVLMLANTGGKERSREEYKSLLERSGFRIRKFYSTITFQELIEAEKEI